MATDSDLRAMLGKRSKLPRLLRRATMVDGKLVMKGPATPETTDAVPDVSPPEAGKEAAPLSPKPQILLKGSLGAHGVTILKSNKRQHAGLDEQEKALGQKVPFWSGPKGGKVTKESYREGHVYRKYLRRPRTSITSHHGDGTSGALMPTRRDGALNKPLPLTTETKVWVREFKYEDHKVVAVVTPSQSVALDDTSTPRYKEALGELMHASIAMDGDKPKDSDAAQGVIDNHKTGALRELAVSDVLRMYNLHEKDVLGALNGKAESYYRKVV